MYLKLMTIFFPAILLTGCVLTTEPYRLTKHHDLGIPKVQNPDGPNIEINKFKMNGPYLFKMVFRADDNQLKIDEYNKWAQVPEHMLTRYLKMAFSGNDKTKKPKTFTISGTVLAFEGDHTSCNAILTVECQIQENGEKKRKVSFFETYLENMKTSKPTKLAPAMSENAKKFANRIKKEINNLK